MGFSAFSKSRPWDLTKGGMRFALTLVVPGSVAWKCKVPGMKPSLVTKHRESKLKQWKGSPLQKDLRLGDARVLQTFDNLSNRTIGQLIPGEEPVRQRRVESTCLILPRRQNFLFSSLPEENEMKRMILLTLWVL